MSLSCKEILQAGDRKGTECGKQSVAGKEVCSYHSAKSRKKEKIDSIKESINNSIPTIIKERDYSTVSVPLPEPLNVPLTVHSTAALPVPLTMSLPEPLTSALPEPLNVPLTVH